MRALALANGRFWTSVAPATRRELARWREIACEIGDRELRELALAKLAQEAFNAEVAATLATLAPRSQRTQALKAIVALEVLFDYLDGRTERLFDGSAGEACRVDAAGRSGLEGAGQQDADAAEGERARADGRAEPDPEQALGEGRRLSQSLAAVIGAQAPQLSGADSGYLDALWRYAHQHACTLPGFAAVAPAGLDAAARCAEAQLRLHAAAAIGEEQLQAWAWEACAGSGLGWREYVGGCASSVLAMHALIATAARADVGEAEAWALDQTYLAIGAVITTLDSLVDDAQDASVGERGYIRVYDGRGEIQERLIALCAEALARAGALRDGAHHAMTLAGVAAYYTTHPGAADSENRAVRAALRRQLAPTIWPALAVLLTWRGAKRVRSAVGARGRRQAAGANAATGEHPAGRG